MGNFALQTDHLTLEKMRNESTDQIVIETTDDGLFMAYILGHAMSYALGETEEEARENLLDRFDLSYESWADPDEYSYLASAMAF